MVKFKSKEEALLKLVNLIEVNPMDEIVILAISENGIYYAQELSKRLAIYEADFMFSEEIVAPHNKECVLGTITETNDFVFIDELIDSFEISRDFLYSEAKRVYEEKIISYMYKYRQGDQIIDLENKRVLLVDEGATTGLTLEACIKSCINSKVKQIDVVIPIVPKSLASQVRKVADNCYFVYEVENFVETNFYFEDRKEKYEL